MKKERILYLLGVFLLIPALAACGGNKSASTGTNTDRLNTNYENALSVETQLVLGTLKLEGTAQAVDSEMAAQLLPLYTLLEQMSSSGTAAQEEIDAVLDQIQGTMTPDQIHAIAAMKLTQTELMDYMRSSGRSPVVGTGTPGTGSSGMGGFPGGPGGEGGPPSGGFPEGGGPGEGASSGGGSSGNGGNINQNQIATLRAQRTGIPGYGGNGTPVFLINELIQVLQKKVPTSTPTP
jgi:hypothetical protein